MGCFAKGNKLWDCRFFGKKKASYAELRIRVAELEGKLLELQQELERCKQNDVSG